MPLTLLTSSIQRALSNAGEDYYIAQRLKRKPQIIRKLQRLHVRLTQLQDVGGLRIIVDDNDSSNRVSKVIDSLILDSNFTLARDTDYRPSGRDDSGYRALHKIVSIGGTKLEIQIRTSAQHHWAESIERTSVFYGKRLKEGEGSNVVLLYFRNLSEAFADMERGNRIGAERRSALTSLQRKSEEIIRRDGNSHLMDGAVNEDVVKTLVQKERANPSHLNNWILVFDWKTANFVTWDIVSRDPTEAVKTYARYEREFPEHESFEVVLIGSSNVSTVQKTHSHYFGIANPEKILDDLGQPVALISEDVVIDRGAKVVLHRLAKRKVWGETRGIQSQTLKNHFCKDVERLEESIEVLVEKGYVIDKGGSGLTLNASKSVEIERLI